MHDFIRLEVETGTTFATVALGTDDPDKKREDTAKARKALDTALRFIAEVRRRFPDDPVASGTMQALQGLKEMLIELGEPLAA